jgi:predicted esterase
MFRRLVFWTSLTAAGLLAVALGGSPVRAADNYLDEAGAARTGKLDMRQQSVDCNYYMYIPKAYTPKKKWPLIVSAPGTFPFDSPTGTRDAWIDAAEKYGFIICCPDFKSATGLLDPKGDQAKLASDDKNVVAILQELRARYSLNPDGVAITGWSGGGFPAHYIGLHHPDLFRAIIGRTATFSEDLVDDETARKARHLHIFCFFATNDFAGIPEQNRRANFWYTTHGFLNFEIREVPGGHAKNNDLAGQWFSDLLHTWPVVHVEASKKSGQAPLAVDFRAAATAPAGGKIVSYIWQFGDGAVSVQPSVTHTFDKPKLYNVFLTVIDQAGHREYAQTDIEVR